MEQLENLVRVKQLHPEPPSQDEIDGLMTSARSWLADSRVEGVSPQGRFNLAYAAAHGLARAALRWHGYRTDQRYIVFQCLQHTVGMESYKLRVLIECHRRRNLAEYEGQIEVDAQLVEDLIEITEEVLARVEALGPVG